MKKSIFLLMLFLLLLSPLAFTQSRDTGAIIGTVTDEEGTALPGATVTLTSPNLMGPRTSTTDAQGQYRFPALPPGDYVVKAELQGFATVIQENVRLTTTTRLTVDFTLKQSAVAEEVTVIAQSPTVDIKSTETASVTLSNEILRNIPYSQFTADIVNLAPGVSTNADVAYGAQDGTGIAYSMDGVNVADPEGGTAWVFLDHNIVEEAKVMGIGLPAEYGNFTGVIFNLITKSGGNEFSGHFELDFQGKKEDKPKGLWQTDNNQAFADDFPKLTAPLFKLFDVNAHLGGPIKRDKVWFFAGLQYYRTQNYPTGFPEAVDYKQPRSFLKITSQLSSKTNLTASLEVDTYVGINRAAGSTISPEATVEQDSPEVVANFSLTHILSPKTFIDVKAAYFWGYYYLEPETGRDKYAHFFGTDNPYTAVDDFNKLFYCSDYFYLADRSRFQTNASVTHYAEDFIQGNHDFKFGVEFEHSWTRSQYGYPGQGGPLGDNIYYYDSWAYPYDGNYLAYQYAGYDFNVRYTRVEAFAQDSWQITPRININAGVRFSQNWGTISEVSGTVWNSNRIAPRIGFTFDIFGDKSTIFKAHYGQFTEGMFAAYFTRLSPKWSDYVSYQWDPEAKEWYEFDRVPQNWSLQDNIKHPYLDQFTVSLERELFRDTSISVSYIHRNWKNIIGVYDLLAQYEQVSYYSSALDQSLNVYNLISGGAHQFQIENLREGTDRPYIGGNPYRQYRGLEVLFNKRFSNRWQLLLSYVYSQTKGTIDNGWGDDIGWNGRNDQQAGDPNFWINADGYATFNPEHMLKAQGTYVLPFDINFNFYFRTITGNGWAQRVRTGTRYAPGQYFGQGRVTFFTEQRGSQHYETDTQLDVRLEKVFTLAGKYRLGVMIDVFNVLNADTITNWGTRIGYDWNEGDYPSTDGHELYGIVRPRQARVGIRLIF